MDEFQFYRFFLPSHFCDFWKIISRSISALFALSKNIVDVFWISREKKVNNSNADRQSEIGQKNHSQLNIDQLITLCTVFVCLFGCMCLEYLRFFSMKLFFWRIWFVYGLNWSLKCSASNLFFVRSFVLFCSHQIVLVIRWSWWWSSNKWCQRRWWWWKFIVFILAGWLFGWLCFGWWNFFFFFSLEWNKTKQNKTRKTLSEKYTCSILSLTCLKF